MSGDAVATDGSLKDASKIEWFNDADDEVPMQQSSHHLGSTMASTSAQSLDDFFSSRAPAKRLVVPASPAVLISHLEGLLILTMLRDLTSILDRAESGRPQMVVAPITFLARWCYQMMMMLTALTLTMVAWIVLSLMLMEDLTINPMMMRLMHRLNITL